MAKPLNKYQKEINAEVNKLNDSFKNFTSKEFETDVNAIMLEKLVRAYENYMDNKIIDTELFLDYSDLQTKIQEYLFNAAGKKDFKENLLWQAGDKRYDYDAVVEFWGINRISLIKKLIHDDYTVVSMGTNEYFDNPIRDVYIKNRNKWVEICKTVDQFISFTKDKFPNWNTMKASEKKLYIQSLDKILDAPFIKDKEYLELYISFLNKFGLNQGKKAKAKLLLQFNFPNITDEKIALELIEYTNLFILSNTKK